jgi:glycosyltransferase involved in cell wall biosynthesis
MSKTINILHISLDFNYSCGVSKHVYSLLKGLQENHSYRLFFITNGGDALDKLKDINISPVILNFSKRPKNILNIYSNLKILKRFCFENEIDIMHTHHRYPEFLAHIISKRTGIKTIATAHSLVKGKRKFSFNSDKIIAVSNSVSDLLKDYYKISGERIIVLYNFLEMFNN